MASKVATPRDDLSASSVSSSSASSVSSSSASSSASTVEVDYDLSDADVVVPPSVKTAASSRNKTASGKVAAAAAAAAAVAAGRSKGSSQHRNVSSSSTTTTAAAAGRTKAAKAPPRKAAQNQRRVVSDAGTVTDDSDADDGKAIGDATASPAQEVTKAVKTKPASKPRATKKTAAAGNGKEALFDKSVDVRADVATTTTSADHERVAVGSEHVEQKRKSGGGTAQKRKRNVEASKAPDMSFSTAVPRATLPHKAGVDGDGTASAVQGGALSGHWEWSSLPWDDVILQDLQLPSDERADPRDLYGRFVAQCTRAALTMSFRDFVKLYRDTKSIAHVRPKSRVHAENSLAAYQQRIQSFDKDAFRVLDGQWLENCSIDHPQTTDEVLAALEAGGALTYTTVVLKAALDAGVRPLGIVGVKKHNKVASYEPRIYVGPQRSVQNREASIFGQLSTDRRDAEGNEIATANASKAGVARRAKRVITSDDAAVAAGDSGLGVATSVEGVIDAGQSEVGGVGVTDAPAGAGKGNATADVGSSHTRGTPATRDSERATKKRSRTNDGSTYGAHA